MASLEVPNSTGTNSLLARLIGSDEMETNVTSNGAIISRKGTIRGVQDSVKNTIQNFKKMKAKPDASPMLRRAMEAECENEVDGKRGQVVVYVTSVQAVRSTYEECRQVVQILRNMRVDFQQKDIFLHPDYRKELMERLATDKPTVPQVFIKGHHIGDGKTIIDMNELSTLTPLLEEFQTDELEECELCGGRGVLLCLWCQGSKKGIRNNFTDLKCTVCNENGLQVCPECSL